MRKLRFIFKLLHKIKQPWFKLIVLGPFVYGFFTYNLRNWYFWVGLAVVYSSWKLIKKEEIRNGIANKELIVKKVSYM